MTELKPQWKELIEREWIRRENKLMYEVIHKLSIQWENYGKQV